MNDKICNPCPAPECSHPECEGSTPENPAPRYVQFVGYAPGTCPSCKHPQHVGRTCGWEGDGHVREVVQDGASYLEPVRCLCTPQDAIKQTKGKARGFRLLPWDALAEIAGVYQYGIEKGYLAESWRNVDLGEYEDAMFRHWAAHKRGELIDPESGLRHVAHFAWNALAVLVLSR